MQGRRRARAAAIAAGLIAAAAAAMLLAPAAALAHRHRLFPPHPLSPGSCRVSMQVAPHHITAGEPIVIFGRLRCAGRHGESGRTVQLFHRLSAQPRYSFVQSTTTGPRGYYEISRADGVVETNRSFYVASGGARSQAQQVDVGAQVTLAGPPEGTQLLTGKRNEVTFTGTVKPADAGALVVLQRQDAANGQTWHRIDTAVVGAGGTFSIPHSFIVPGDANIRAFVRSEGRNVPSASNLLTYEISQAQNSALSIEASADPIVVGQSLTIKGTLANAAAGTPLQLFTRTRNGRYSAVAETTTTVGGAYSFAAQSPLHSTFYAVKGGGETSAVLYEGVHFSLTAQASSTSVTQGQPVTFTGSVAPEQAGHVIYLEAQDAFSSDYHVIGIGFVGASSTYALTHRFYVAGSRVVRIYIPGGPENEGAASQPFTIAVTPAPAPSLVPEPEGNTGEAPEGQS
jgi:hypothetical protein